MRQLRDKSESEGFKVEALENYYSRGNIMEEYIYLDNAATTFPKPGGGLSGIDRANRNAAVNGRDAVAHWQNRQNS